MNTQLYLVYCLFIVTIGWNTNQKETFRKIPTKESIIFDVAYSNFGRVIIVADGSEIKWFDADSFELLAESKGAHRGHILSLDISADSTILVSAGQDSSIVVWNVRENKLEERLGNHQGLVTSVSISNDSRYLLSGGTDRKVVLYDLQQKNVVKTYENHTKDVTVVKFSPNNSDFCSGSGDKKIFFYNTKEDTILDSMSFNGWIRDLSFSPSGNKMLISGDFAKVVEISMDPIKKVETTESNKYDFDWIFASRFHSDPTVSACGGLRGEVRIETEYSTYSANLKSIVNDLEFDPTNHHQLKLAVATMGKGVYLLDAATMKAKVKRR